MVQDEDGCRYPRLLPRDRTAFVSEDDGRVAVRDNAASTGVCDFIVVES